MSSYVVTFNLKSLFMGDAVPIIYGNCKELGNGEPTNGIEFINNSNDIYNYQAKIRFSNEINKDTIWYSYCFRPSYGSMILENAPRRFLPRIQLKQDRPDKPSNLQTYDILLYDTIDEITPVDEFILNFRVRCFTQFGQHLYIVGSCESLGNWDPKNAIQLFYEGNQDYWSGKVKIPLSNSPRVIEYKYFRSFVPKRKQNPSKSNNTAQQSENTNSQRANAYKDLYKDFYKSKNQRNSFFNSNRGQNFNEKQSSKPKTAETVKGDTNNDDFDLRGIEWEPADVPNHRIEIGPVTSPTVLEISDTFRWSDPDLYSLTTSPFVDVMNARKSQISIQNKIEKKIELNNSKPGIVTVRFEAICPNIMKHQDLYIVGSISELGNWKFEKGLKMDDSNFPLFVATVDLKRKKRKEKVEPKAEDATKPEESKTTKPKEVESFSFPFEYKFVVVGSELKDCEVEVDDDSPLTPEEEEKLAKMKLELQQKARSTKSDKDKAADFTDEQLIKSMKRKKKVIQKRIEKVGIWESSPNRYCSGITSHVIPETYPSTLLIHSWYVNPNPELMKRYGVSVPLFSLRSSDSCGVGQYGDIRQLADFCQRVGASLIQFPLPLFDTSTSVLSEVLSSFSDNDSKALNSLSSLSETKLRSSISDVDENPFNIVSAFALHPIYVSLLDISPIMPKEISDDINAAKWELEKRQDVDYRLVYAYKMRMLWKIYREVVVVDKRKSDPKSKDFDYSSFYQSKMGALLLDDMFEGFVQRESHWLYPYALFCFFREKYREPDFRRWPEEVSAAFVRAENFEEAVGRLRSVAENETKEGQFDLTFFMWVQYVCSSQFSKARKYAQQCGVAFEGCFPLNVSLTSSDCWSFPRVFRHPKSDNLSDYWRFQTVVVPEEPNAARKTHAPVACASSFRSNFVFPSFDWSFLDGSQQDASGGWWCRRARRCCDMFHALQIDPALGLYRSWEVDASKCVTSCLGHFTPCSTIGQIDLDARCLRDARTYTRPCITRRNIEQAFGHACAREVLSRFFTAADESPDAPIEFKLEYDSERKLYDALSVTFGGPAVVSGVENEQLAEVLMRLADDVLLIEDEGHPGQFYVRSNFFNQPLVALGNRQPNLTPSESYSRLLPNERNAMNDLYDYYTYTRQNELWLRLSRARQRIIQAQQPAPLVCIDDSEVARCGSLSYEIRGAIGRQNHAASIPCVRAQRLPKMQSNGQFPLFDNPLNFEYLSISSPSLHYTSTLRGWWLQEPEKAASLWREQLRKEHAEPPKELDADTQEEVVRQCMTSRSELAVFLLQDVAGIVPFFRRQDPAEERITKPKDAADDAFQSCEDSCRISYRLPYYLGDLINNDELTQRLRDMSAKSNRAHFNPK